MFRRLLHTKHELSILFRLIQSFRTHINRTHSKKSEKKYSFLTHKNDFFGRRNFSLFHSIQWFTLSHRRSWARVVCHCERFERFTWSELLRAWMRCNKWLWFASSTPYKSNRLVMSGLQSEFNKNQFHSFWPHSHIVKTRNIIFN